MMEFLDMVIKLQKIYEEKLVMISCKSSQKFH